MDKYKRIRPVGRGANGECYLVKHRETQEKFVLKRIPFQPDPALISHIENNHRLSQGTNYVSTKSLPPFHELNEVTILNDVPIHPNVIKYQDSFVEVQSHGSSLLTSSSTNTCSNIKVKSLWIVMEFGTRGDLGNKMRKMRETNPEATLSETHIAYILVQILLALQHLHSNRIIHRDLKPENIFLSEDGLIKLGDFGVSKDLTSSDFAATFVGSPTYMSPELMANKAYNEKSDMWALGCLTYELITQRKPFEGENLLDLQVAITSHRSVGKWKDSIKRVEEKSFTGIESALTHKPCDTDPVSKLIAFITERDLKNTMNTLWDCGRVSCITDLVTEEDSLLITEPPAEEQDLHGMSTKSDDSIVANPEDLLSMIPRSSGSAELVSNKQRYSEQIGTETNFLKYLDSTEYSYDLKVIVKALLDPMPESRPSASFLIESDYVQKQVEILAQELPHPFFRELNLALSLTGSTKSAFTSINEFDEATGLFETTLKSSTMTTWKISNELGVSMEQKVPWLATETSKSKKRRKKNSDNMNSSKSKNVDPEMLHRLLNTLAPASDATDQVTQQYNQSPMHIRKYGVSDASESDCTDAGSSDASNESYSSLKDFSFLVSPNTKHLPSAAISQQNTYDLEQVLKQAISRRASNASVDKG